MPFAKQSWNWLRAAVVDEVDGGAGPHIRRKIERYRVVCSSLTTPAEAAFV